MRSWIGYASWALMAIIVGTEISSLAFIKIQQTEGLRAPGLGISALALLDGFLFYSWTSKTFSPFLNRNIQVPLLKISDFIVILVLFIFCIITLFAGIALTMLMISLLLAIPFGTIAYMAAYASFPTASAEVTLGVLMSLKMLFAISLVIGEKRLFQDFRVFLLVLLFSFISNLIVGLLHNLVPSILVSITDAISAIIIAIIALIWIFISLIPSTIGLVTLIIDVIGGIGKTTSAIKPD